MIARENGETPWSEDAWKDYYLFVKQKGNIIVGRKTFELMQAADEFVKLGNPVTIVLSSNQKNQKGNLFFVNSPQQALELLKKKEFKEAVLGGGAKTNMSFLKNSLVDEIILTIEPLLFGKGIPLFAQEDFEAHLELIEVKKLTKNEIQLHYKVVKDSAT